MNLVPIALTTLILGAATYLGIEPTSPLAPRAAHDCKPGSPVQLVVVDRDVRPERATLRYELHAELELEDVWVEAYGDVGCAVTRHDAAEAARLAPHATRSGRLDLAFDDVQGARAHLIVNVSFVGVDEAGNPLRETLAVTHLETFGAPLDADDVVPVTTDGEVSLSMPTSHR